MINKREWKILQELVSEKVISLDYLIEQFKVSARTIQYNVNNINFYLIKEGLNKISIKNGILLSNHNDIKNFLNKYNSYEIDSEDIKNIILLYAIFNENGLNISNLSKFLNISRNTLIGNFKNLKKDFKYINGKGYFLDVSNNEKIELLSKFYNNPVYTKFIEEIIDHKTIELIKTFLKEVSKVIKLNINNELYKNTLLSIYCYTKFPEHSQKINMLVNEEYTKIYNIAINFFDNENSISHILDILMGISVNSNLKNWINDGLLMTKLIQNVSSYLNINLINDKILLDFLSSHIKAAIFRIKKGILLEKEIYDNLISKDDKLKDIVKLSLKEIENVFSVEFIESELNLIVFHFKASIDRTKINQRKKVILVCGMGYGTSRILEYNLKEQFDIDIIDVLPKYMLNSELIENKSIDHIITTIDLDVESIKINPVLKAQDYEKLENVGIYKRKDKIFVDNFLDDLLSDISLSKEQLKTKLLNRYGNIFYENKPFEPSNLLNLLSSEKVSFIDKIADFEEAMKFMTNKMIKRKSIEPSYLDSILSNVKNYGDYIVISEGIAIPHARNNDNVHKTDIELLILKNPINIKDKEVRLLFCFSSKDGYEHLEVLKDLYNLVNDDNFYKKVTNFNSYIELERYLINKIERDNNDI